MIFKWLAPTSSVEGGNVGIIVGFRLVVLIVRSTQSSPLDPISFASPAGICIGSLDVGSFGVATTLVSTITLEIDTALGTVLVVGSERSRTGWIVVVTSAGTTAPTTAIAVVTAVAGGVGCLERGQHGHHSVHLGLHRGGSVREHGSGDGLDRPGDVATTYCGEASMNLV